MQQILLMLKTASETAQQKGYKTTQQQLELWHAQLEAFASTQTSINPLMTELLRKSIAGVQASLDDRTNGAATDAALSAQFQAQAITLFQSLNLVQEYVTQRQNVRQSNQNAQKNQKYYDKKKNDALTTFNTYLAQLLQKNILTNEDLVAFNNRLRETLIKDFGVKNLAQPQPRAASQGNSGPAPQSMAEASNLASQFTSSFSNAINAAKNNDPEAMKEASKNFIGFLISMVVECIANIFRTLSPSMGPFISQMATLAKGAFANWFSSSLDTAIPSESAQTAQPENAEPENTAQAPEAKQQTPVSEGAAPGILHAQDRFMQQNAGMSMPFMSSPAPASSPSAKATGPRQ